MNNFYLHTADGLGGLLLPFSPESFEITMGADNEEYTLMNRGEIVVPGHVQCKRISFRSWLTPSHNPWEVIATWEKYMREKKVMRLVIVGATVGGMQQYEINMPAVFVQLTTTEKGGEPGVVFFDVVFKEYRSFSLKVIS